MKKTLFLIAFLILPGCLFFDEPTTCDDNATCLVEDPKVYGTFLEHQEKCFSNRPEACSINDCEEPIGYNECRHYVRFSLTNPGLTTTFVSAPENVSLYPTDNQIDQMFQPIDDLFFSGASDTLNFAEAEERGASEGFKRVLELTPDESVELTFTFTDYFAHPVEAKASIDLEVQNQETISILTNPINLGASAPTEPVTF